MRPVFLIGYMGSGKSALGRAVNRLTGMEVIDLDLYIEGRYRKSISELFAERGEAGIRTIERAMLDEVSQFEDVVIACGGGTPCFGDNMALMNSRGITVWLNTPLDTLHRRLCRSRHKRPLIAKFNDDELLDYIRTHTEARRPYYSQARYELASAGLDSRSGADDVARQFLKLLGLPQP